MSLLRNYKRDWRLSIPHIAHAFYIYILCCGENKSLVVLYNDTMKIPVQ